MISILNSLLSFLKILENTSISNLMINLEESVLNNILKYNLQEKVGETDEKYKKYKEEYKL